MAKRDYNKMYETKPETEVVTENNVFVEEDIKEEKKTNKEEKKNTGKVVGGASLNVRFSPAGKIDSTIAEGVLVKIEEDLGDWYRISEPKPGYVMKKFIEV